MTDFQIIACALSGLACFAVGYTMASPRRIRKVKCMLGLHAPDRPHNQGFSIVQRCLYCEKLLHKFDQGEQHGTRRQ